MIPVSRGTNPRILKTVPSVPATTLLAMSTKHVREGLVYHTPRDTVEHVEPAVVEACMRVVLRFLERAEAAVAA